MAGNFLSNFGLVSEGMDAGTRARQGIAAEDQHAQIRDQSIKTGAMGLEEATRVRDKASSIRTAGAKNGSFEDMATAAEAAGDPETAFKFRQANKAIQDEGFKNVIHGALKNPTPGPRPDLAEEFNRYGKVKVDPATMSLDDKGNLSYVDPKTNKPGTFNVGDLAVRMGMVKPWEKEIPAGGMYVRERPGKEPLMIRNEKPAEFKVSDGIMWNDKTGAFQQVGQGDWKIGNITHGNMEVPVSINSKTGEVQQLGPGGVRTGIKANIVQPTVPGGPVMIEMPGGAVAEFKPATEATPGKTNLFSPNVPGTPAQPSRIVPVAGAEAAPVEGARRAPDGKWYVPDPARPGKYLEAAPTGAEKPAAKPAAKPEREAGKDYRSKNEETRKRVAADAAEADKVIEKEAPAPAKPISSDAAERAVEKGRSAKAKFENTSAIKLPGKASSVDEARAALKKTNPNVADKMLLESYKDSKELTKEERAKIQEIIGQGYSRGGKVTKAGLGG